MSVVAAQLTERRGRVRLGSAHEREQERERASLLLTVRDEDGRIGRGECAPWPTYAPADAVELRAYVGSRHEPTRPAARFAVESALADLAGQALDCATARLWAAEKIRPSVALNRVIATRAQAEAALADGVTTWKVKIGADFAADLRWLTELRRLSSTVALRLDANCAFAADVVHERLRALAEFSPEYVEEPYAGGLACAPAPSGLPPVPLAVDESFDEALWPRLSTLGVRVVVVKPMRHGLSAARALAARVAEAGLDLVVTHEWDGPVGAAAALQLALAAPGRVRACGLAQHAGWSLWPELDVPGIGLDSARAVGTGLGVVQR